MPSALPNGHRVKLQQLPPGYEPPEADLRQAGPTMPAAGLHAKRIVVDSCRLILCMLFAPLAQLYLQWDDGRAQCCSSADQQI